MEDNKNSYSNWKIVTMFLTSFLLWVTVCYSFTYKDAKNYTNLNSQVINKQENKVLDLHNLQDVYSIIKARFYWVDTMDVKKLESWMIKWLVESLWDKHSEYMDISETKEFSSVLSWDFEWIWAIIEKNDFWVSIDRILKWSPAEKAWVLKWDIITKANDIDLKWMEVYEAVEKIKWPAWTKVVLEILREKEKDAKKIEVVRRKIVIPSVETKILENNIGYISLNMFGDNSTQDFTNALVELNSKTHSWIIIDLRNNWGWYLNSAVEILSNFIENKKVLVTTKYKSEIYNTNYFSKNDWTTIQDKIVVLINENSASASEITAWALKDYKKAIIVGKKSYWKWSVQEPYDLKDGSMLKLTIAKWYTPLDKNIDWEWIMPDVEVDFKEEDYKNIFDRQLDVAKKVILDFEKTNDIEKTISKFAVKSWTWNTSTWITNTWSIKK